MKTRHTFILLLAMFAAFSAKAQNKLSVASFQLIENDLTAILHGTEVKDQNGNTCALIKVQNPHTGFAFDVGIMGITKTEQHTGEIWVWVPFGVKHLSIHHQQLGHLNDYHFPCSIEKGRTYRLELISGTVTSVIEEDLGGSYLMITVEPKTAQVYVDDRPKTVENGEVKMLLPYGRHTYRVESPNYMTEAGIVEIDTERQELNISLTSAKATLTVSCTDAEADIFINEAWKGRGSWTGQLDEGMYALEARKAGHRTVKQSLTLAKQEQKSLTLNAPEPIYGKLNLDSSPGNCEVYLDGTKIGKSPDIFSNILVGSHTLELRKDGYESQSRQINIEENKITEFEMTLQLVGSVAQQPEVQQAEPMPQQDLIMPMQKDKCKTFIMARANATSNRENKPLFGISIGQVKKTGWYVSCLSTFNLYDEQEVNSFDTREYKYSFLDLTAGAVFRCTNSFYLYTGAGWAMRMNKYYYYSYYSSSYDHYDDNDDGGVNIEAGAMFHLKNFSIMAGVYGITITHNYDIGLQIGVGYNFGFPKSKDMFYKDSQNSGILAQQTESECQPNEKPVKTDKKKTFIMADASIVRGHWMGGLTFGQVKENGWYTKCMTYFDNLDVLYGYGRCLDMTGGGIFGLVKPLYVYIGAGYTRWIEDDIKNSVKFEGGVMLHFRGLSISAGIDRRHPNTGDFCRPSIGVGFNF